MKSSVKRKKRYATSVSREVGIKFSPSYRGFFVYSAPTEGELTFSSSQKNKALKKRTLQVRFLMVRPTRLELAQPFD